MALRAGPRHKRRLDLAAASLAGRRERVEPLHLRRRQHWRATSARCCLEYLARVVVARALWDDRDAVLEVPLYADLRGREAALIRDAPKDAMP